jgi:hypothetical protein
MYRATAIFFGVIFAESIIEQVLFVGILGEAEVPTVIDRVGNLVVSAICGAYGNAWYLSHTKKQITRLRSQGLPKDEYLDRLSRRGGTSLVASVGSFILFVAAIIAVFAGLEMVTAGD